MPRNLSSWRAFSLLIAFISFVGCGKKKESVEADSGSTESGSPAYQIMLADRKPGTKSRVKSSRSEKMYAVMNGKEEAKELEKSQFEYVEHVLNETGGKPTKLTRSYLYAQKEADGRGL